MAEVQRSLERARRAIRRTPAERRRPPGPGPNTTLVGLMGLSFILLGFFTGNHHLLRAGLALAGIGAVLLLVTTRDSSGGGRRPAKRGISPGASIAAGAHVHPTAVVEIGASVGPGAHLGPGSVTRMGAHVGASAVLEAAAMVSWGAHVGDGAVVGEAAVVGAGCEVAAGARVPARLVLGAATSFAGTAPLPDPTPASPQDPRAARVAAACAKLDAELRASPDGLRPLLGGGSGIVLELRHTCEELLERESVLRNEASALGQLADERAVIQRRVEAEQDAQVRDSLRGALAAIDGQIGARERLRLAADRLDAEHTRLLYTLEQLAAQSARLRSAGDGAAHRPHDLQLAVEQLRDELEAIADALEAVAGPPARLELP